MSGVNDFQRTRPFRTSIEESIFAFALEVAIFVCLGIWGWHLGGGGLTGSLLAALIVVLVGAVWGLCRKLGDLPHGRSRVPIPGPVRLAIELSALGLAVYGIWAAGSRAAGETLLTAGVIHYGLMWERVRWLPRGR